MVFLICLSRLSFMSNIGESFTWFVVRWPNPNRINYHSWYTSTINRFGLVFSLSDQRQEVKIFASLLRMITSTRYIKRTTILFFVNNYIFCFFFLLIFLLLSKRSIIHVISCLRSRIRWSRLKCCHGRGGLFDETSVAAWQPWTISRSSKSKL